MKNCLSIVAILLAAPILVYTAQISGLSGGSTSLEPNKIVLPKLAVKHPTPAIFSSVIAKAEVSGGVVAVRDSCAQDAEKTVSIAEGTPLSEALDQIALADGSSRWEVRDGVVNLLPLSDLPSLLQVQIKSFSWDKSASVQEVVAQLRVRPEILERAGSLGLREMPHEGGVGTICIRDCGKSEKTPDIQVEQNVTLMTILNTIARAHKQAVWIYSEYHCNGGTRFRLEATAP